MHTTIERAKSNSSKSHSHTDSNLVASIPYFKSSASSLKKFLARYDISTSFHSNTNLKSILSHTKSATPVCNVKNVIYKIPCGDCNQFYIGQTSRPLIKRIKEHETCFRLNNHTDSSTGNIKSAPLNMEGIMVIESVGNQPAFLLHQTPRVNWTSWSVPLSPHSSLIWTSNIKDPLWIHAGAPSSLTL